MQAPKLLRTLAARQLQRQYHEGGHVSKFTLNDMPTPQGNWKTHYEANQRRYNTHLLFGVGFLIASFMVGKVGGLYEMNWEIPKRPADIASYKN